MIHELRHVSTRNPLAEVRHYIGSSADSWSCRSSYRFRGGPKAPDRGDSRKPWFEGSLSIHYVNQLLYTIYSIPHEDLISLRGPAGKKR